VRVEKDMVQEHERDQLAPDTRRDTALAHLYGAMYCLVALGEAGGSGAVARAARIGQVELWPVIEHLGGSARAFTDWREAHERQVGGHEREA